MKPEHEKVVALSLRKFVDCCGSMRKLQIVSNSPGIFQHVTEDGLKNPVSKISDIASFCRYCNVGNT